MAKTIDGVTGAIITASTTAEAGRFITKQQFQQQFSFATGFKDKDRAEFYEEVKHLTAARMAHEASKLAMGKHLLQLQELLTPYEAFGKFLTKFKFTGKTAYRYINGYKNACAYLRDAYIKGAIARGIDIMGDTESKPLGKYTAAYNAGAKPPKDDDPATVNRFYDQLLLTHKEYVKKRTQLRLQGKVLTEDEVERDPEVLLQQWFRVGKNALNHVPKRKRRSMLESVVGMWLTQLGVGNTTSFSPEAIPKRFRQGRGRPQLVPTLEGKQEQRSA